MTPPPTAKERKSAVEEYYCAECKEEFGKNDPERGEHEDHDGYRQITVFQGWVLATIDSDREADESVRYIDGRGRSFIDEEAVRQKIEALRPLAEMHDSGIALYERVLKILSSPQADRDESTTKEETKAFVNLCRCGRPFKRINSPFCDYVCAGCYKDSKECKCEPQADRDESK